TFIAKLAVEAFDERVLDGPPGFNELQPDAAIVGPRIKGAADKLWTVVQEQRHGTASERTKSLQHAGDADAGNRSGHFDRDAFAGEVIDAIDGPKGASVRQGIRREVHRPALVYPSRDREWLPLPP